MNINETNDGMMSISSHCSKFSKRHDVNVFNMIDYQTCENCTHMTDDNRCIVKAQKQTSGLNTF